ncbi:MAG TPA: YjbF family lipoprotein [Rhizomicrobium sp.]|nr:YjbF family lipoprotein [Rhizomicrobium sp.]
MGVALVCGLWLCGCSSDGGDWEQIYKVAKASWAGDSTAVTLQQASATPYASLGLRVGGGPETIVVLATDQNERLLWTSAAKIAIETENGRIVRSAGFPGDVNAVVFRGADPLALFAQGERHPQTTTRTMDFNDLDVFGVSVRCDMTDDGPETITILGTGIETNKLSETCQSDQLDWTFKNVFWMGKSGLVWKSIQYIHPKSEPLTVELLRPPG